jgi:hypothetical protein
MALQTWARLSDCPLAILHDGRGDAWLKVSVFENICPELDTALGAEVVCVERIRRSGSIVGYAEVIAIL